MIACNQDGRSSHWLRLFKFPYKPACVKMEVRENDTAASVYNREPRRASCAVVFHESRKRCASWWFVVTESDRKLILELVHAQFFKGVLLRTFKNGLDHCETYALGAQCPMQFLQRRKSMQMATLAPVLEREQNLWASPQVRQLERSDAASSILATLPPNSQLRR